MGKVKVGLEYIKLGAIAGDGGMGTTLTAAGLTFLDSATLDQQEGTLTEFFAEESDDPVYSAKTKGKFILNYQIMDWDNSTLLRLAGGALSGTGTAEVWNAPDSDPNIELSVELKFKSSPAVIRIPRAGISARLTGNVGKNNATVLSVELTALKPSKAGTASLTIGAPSATA